MCRWWQISDGCITHGCMVFSLTNPERSFMKQIPDHGINDPDIDLEPPAGGLPCAEGLLAGTLALLTGHAQACCEDHRSLMAAKAASNLVQLSQHPLMSEGFKTVAWNLHLQWVQRVRAAQCASKPAPAMQDGPVHARALWHTTPEVVQ
jgi:hypothetical protein